MARRESFADSDDLRSAPSPQENSFWPLHKLRQDFMPELRSQYENYEDAFVKKVKDGLMIAYEHPAATCGIVVAAGIVLMRGPRRFLLWQTLRRFENEEARIGKVELRLKELGQSVDQLKKDSRNMILRASFGEEELQRGQTKIRDAGYEIRRLSKSIYKVESQAADLMDGLRSIPGRNALKLRAEVASMASDLKDQRRASDKRIMKISEFGIRV